MSKNTNGRDEEVERYKQAANDALQLVDWCIGFFVGSRKNWIAKPLARNRSQIRQNLMHEPAEPVPTGEK